MVHRLKICFRQVWEQGIYKLDRVSELRERDPHAVNRHHMGFIHRPQDARLQIIVDFAPNGIMCLPDALRKFACSKLPVSLSQDT